MNKLVLLFFFLSLEVSLAQTTQFSVSYHGKPACNTNFTITDTLNREIGSGKSDGSGNFSCNCVVVGVFILNAKPDNGSKWSLKLLANPFNAINGRIDVRIEEVEAQFNQGMKEMQDAGNDDPGSGSKADKVFKGVLSVTKKSR